MTEKTPKTDAEYLAEHADWPHILKMRAAILGDIALQKQGIIKEVKSE